MRVLWASRVRRTAPNHPHPTPHVSSTTTSHLPSLISSLLPMPFTPSPRCRETGDIDMPPQLQLERSNRWRPFGSRHSHNLPDSPPPLRHFALVGQCVSPCFASIAWSVSTVTVSTIIQTSKVHSACARSRKCDFGATWSPTLGYHSSPGNITAGLTFAWMSHHTHMRRHS